MFMDLHEDNVFRLKYVKVSGFGVRFFETLYIKKFAIMYREKKGIILDENDEDFRMQRETYLHIHTYLSFVHLFLEVANQFSQPFSMQFYPKESYHEMGIVTNREPITFIHLRYVYFFVATYAAKVLETGKMDGLCCEQLFYDLFFGAPEKEDQPERPFIWKFVDEYLEKVTDWSSLKWLETHVSLKSRVNHNHISEQEKLVNF